MRVKRGFKARRRRKKILKAARGNFGSRSRTYRVAKETVERGWAYAYAHRKLKKRDFRKLWITRINAAVREMGLSYSAFMGKLSKSEIKLDRKMLAHIAAEDSKAFAKIVEEVKGVN